MIGQKGSRDLNTDIWLDRTFIMLEPSSSEEDEDYEPSSGIQNNAKDNNLKPPVANGGPRPVSPSATDGKPGGKVRT